MGVLGRHVLNESAAVLSGATRCEHEARGSGCDARSMIDLFPLVLELK